MITQAITGNKLLALLDEHYKTDRHLIGYVCDGLQPYDADFQKTDPILNYIGNYLEIIRQATCVKIPGLAKDCGDANIDLITEAIKKDVAVASTFLATADLIHLYCERHEHRLTFDDLREMFDTDDLDAIADMLKDCYFDRQDLIARIDTDENPDRTPDKGVRLSTWGEIANFLNVEIRTAQLWHTKYGMPVEHRKGVRTVIAWSAELQAWDKKGLVRKRVRKKAKED